MNKERTHLHIICESELLQIFVFMRKERRVQERRADAASSLACLSSL